MGTFCNMPAALPPHFSSRHSTMPAHSGVIGCHLHSHRRQQQHGRMAGKTNCDDICDCRLMARASVEMHSSLIEVSTLPILMMGYRFITLYWAFLRNILHHPVQQKSLPFSFLCFSQSPGVTCEYVKCKNPLCSGNNARSPQFL